MKKILSVLTALMMVVAFLIVPDSSASAASACTTTAKIAKVGRGHTVAKATSILGVKKMTLTHNRPVYNVMRAAYTAPICSGGKVAFTFSNGVIETSWPGWLLIIR